MTLPKKARIKSRKDFERIFKTGRVISHDGLRVKFQENRLAGHRGAIVAPVAAFPKAVERNRLKRLVSESLEAILKAMARDATVAKKKFMDILVIVQPGVKNKKLSEITAILKNIFQKANIV